ncbi:hypothetical protein D3C87_1761360 [compost metagenome]
MAEELGAREFVVPLPLVFGVSRGVDTHVAAASLDVAFECILLLIIQYIAGGVQEYDRAVLL